MTAAGGDLDGATPLGSAWTDPADAFVAESVTPQASGRAITRASLRSAGQSDRTADRRVGRHELWRAAPSVYLPVQPDLAQRIDAALAHAGPTSVITGWTACLLHGMRYVPEVRAVPVLVAHGRVLVSTPFVQVHGVERRPRWRENEHGWRIAHPVRAVADAARATPDLQSVRALVLAALHEKRVTQEALRRELLEGPRRGSRHLRHALTDAWRGASSSPEAEMADWAVRQAGRGPLGVILLNPDVFADGVFLGRPDGLVRDAWVGWECNSVEHHGEDEDLDATEERSDRFSARGVELLGTSPRRFRRDPQKWLDTLVATVSTRAGRELGTPKGLTVVARGPLLPATSQQVRALFEASLADARLLPGRAA